jgi:hypothetical protein
MARTIQSPGVEIKEVDLSLRPELPTGTTVFIPGFANQGPTDEILTLSSLSEFETVYGLPQNAAERYMYHSVKAVFQSSANVTVSRLPYGLGAGTTVADKYSLLVYPVIPRPLMVDALGGELKLNTVAEDTRLIAWHPKSVDAVDESGDYVLAQSASAVVSEGGSVATLNSKGTFGNEYFLKINIGALDNSREFANGTDFIINTTASKLNGSEITTILNSEFSSRLTAIGGFDDIKGEFTGEVTDATTSGLSAVEIKTLQAGQLAEFTITGETGERASFNDLLDSQDAASTVQIESVVYGTQGNVSLQGSDGAAATFSGTLIASSGTQEVTITANDVGTAGNKSVITNGTDNLETLFGAGYTISVANFTAPAGQTIAVAGGENIPTVQQVADAAEIDLSVGVGGTLPMDSGKTITLEGGVDARNVTQLVQEANGTALVGDHTAEVIQGGDVVLQPAFSITIQGEDAEDTITSSIERVFAGGVDAGLSPKVVPLGEWKFGDTNPGGYVATTLKDAVDSLLAGMGDEHATIGKARAGWYYDTAGVHTLISAAQKEEARQLHQACVDAGNTDCEMDQFIKQVIEDDGGSFNLPLSAYAANDKFWMEEVPGDPLSVPARDAYEVAEVASLVSAAVNGAGWDLAASDRYYIGEPSAIELDNNQFQKTIKGEIKLKETEAGKYSNQKFTTYQDLIDRGGAGLMIVNDKKFVVNEKFEGYYIGLVDNTSLNPASDFDAVGKLKSLSKKLGGTTGGYVDVPDVNDGVKSRLTFSLSAGFIFDEYGNKQQVGLDGSMSEVLENLSEFDLNTEEFSDILSLAVFKVRQSTLEPDTTKLDYLVADSVIGSVNYFREKFLSSGGTSVSYFIESEAENSNNLYLKMNEGMSKSAGNWLDENGFPTRKIRILPANDMRYYDELTPLEKAETTQEVNDFKVSQRFLNRSEERQDRLYIKSWQDLQRDALAQVKHANNVYPHGVYRQQLAEAKQTGNIPAKLDRIFELADNFDLFPIDITCEAGLGTVYVGTKGGTQDWFDDEEYFDIGDHVVSSTGLSGSGLYNTKIMDDLERSELGYTRDYDAVFDSFRSFSQYARKDNIFLADPLRYIFVQGRNSRILTSKNREAGVTFSQHIYWPMRHMMTGGNKNSSYCATYGNWAFTQDKALNRGVWVPTSGYVAQAMANTDSNFAPWVAPAGFTKGILSGLQDLAYYPKQKERDQLYKLGINPITQFPNEGFAIFGQKTMQQKPSAFDRINVRRMFLYLQKAVMNSVKYFVFEPNTLFTRTQLVNVIRPIFEEVKNTQGLYDYLIVCDDRNNSSDVIDNNELVVDIYIKPTRAAEFILVNFYATRTGQDFSELVA